MQAVFETLARTDKILERVENGNRTVANLIKVGEMKLKEGKIVSDKEAIQFKTIYGEDATVTLAHYDRQGARTPVHCHEGIVEYLIVIRGSFSMSVKGGYRVVTARECFKVEEGQQHECIALEDDSLLVAVCVPEEPAYKESMVCQKSLKKS